MPKSTENDQAEIKQDAPDPTVPAAKSPGDDPKAPAKSSEQNSEDWKAQARKWEERARSNFTKAKKLDEIEEANKTELEKVTERAAKAEKAAKDAELKALRAEVASAKGVPLKFVIGQTREEMEAIADDAIEWRGSASKPDPAAPPASGAGKQGDRIASKGEQIVSSDQLKNMKPSEILQARKDGRLDHLMGA